MLDGIMLQGRERMAGFVQLDANGGLPCTSEAECSGFIYCDGDVAIGLSAVLVVESKNQLMAQAVNGYRKALSMTRPLLMEQMQDFRLCSFQKCWVKYLDPLFSLKIKPMAKDKLHEIVKNALEKDGWVVTHDPFFLHTKPRRQEIDLGAEKVIVAERGSDKIAVEVKSFVNKSNLYDFYEALGQYISYRIGLRLQELDRILYLAIPDKTYHALQN